MKNIFLIFIFYFFSLNACSQKNKVVVLDNDQGIQLVVNDTNFIINGMNWDYFPIGTNYTYSLWEQSDSFIETALDSEMLLLKKMGVNTIRVYSDIPPKWIAYIYKKYGIYTVLNHSFGRYGLSIKGVWLPETDYSNVEVQKLLIEQVSKMAEAYKDTPGLLLYLLGNENNYGLFWAGAETEDFPNVDDKNKKIGETRGRPMYKLMNDASIQIKKIDDSHPVAICNGDLLYLEIIAQECKDIDIFGTNMYRGKSFGNAFQRVKNELNLPIMFTEFGSDAFNEIEKKEDQKMQAFYVIENWKEIYQNTAGLKKARNSIGGFTFQFSDGWWKFKQTKNLSIHDINSTWANGGYEIDHTEGSNNMNEEWFGICAKGVTNDKGLYTSYPRAAYYVLKKIHQLNPYKKGTTASAISKYFNTIDISDALFKAKKNKIPEIK